MKKVIIFIVLIMVAFAMIFIGFGAYAVASMPFQDSQLVPADILEKQARDMLMGEIVILMGIAVFFGTVIAAIVSKILEKIKKSGRKADAKNSIG